MGNKNYTNYSKNKNDDKHVISEELEETVLKAGGEVMRVNSVEDQPEETNTEFAVTEEADGVHVRPVVDGEVIDTPVEQIIQPEENQENIDDHSGETDQDNVATEGIVDCEKLYVRKEATINSEPLAIINKSEEVSIDLNESTEDFYKVHTTSEVEGYCMKKFINVK